VLNTPNESQRSMNTHRVRGIAVAVVTAVVVVAGARLAALLSQHMMNAVALVGSSGWA